MLSDGEKARLQMLQETAKLELLHLQQDLLGDKYLPAWLRAVQEPVGTALENLDRAEKLGLVQSADAWISVRKLRNQLVHEYLGRREILHNALFQANDQVSLLAFTADQLVERTSRLIESE